MYLIAIGEIFLKGKNRISFERRLIKNIRAALDLSQNDIIKFRNRYLVIKDENISKLNSVFGIQFYVRCIKSDLDKINKTAASMITDEKTFRISAKKSIILKKNSQTLNEEIGSYILDNKPEIKVNLGSPDIDIRIEELSNKAFLYRAGDIIKGLGGLPVDTGGFVHLISDDEIKSTVAGFLLMKRGCAISFSKDLFLLHKFEHGFNIRIREEKQEDIIATDETFDSFEIKEDDKFILRPLIGYTQEQIKEIYSKIKSI